MKRISILLTLFCLLTSSLNSFAQIGCNDGINGSGEVCEDCNDGIDNDNDGFIDCWDADCTFHPDCEGSPLQPSVDCEAAPAQVPQFSMQLDWASPNETTFHLGRAAIGDIDGDGMPEVVTGNYMTGTLTILNGKDGSIERQQYVGGNASPQYDIAIANIDTQNPTDVCGEIFTYGYNKKTYRITAYDCNLNLLWMANTPVDPGTLSLADFDGDGRVELYYRNEIRDARTGTLIISGGDRNALLNVNAGPVAVDILGDDDLELVVGGTVYDVNLGDRSANSGSLTILKQLTDYQVKNRSNMAVSMTSIADYNLDGNLDVIASGADSKGFTTIFFWDVVNDNVKKYKDVMTRYDSLTCVNSQLKQRYLKGWENGTGRVNIGDLDGDGKMNVSYVSGRFLYALDENLQLKWKIQVKEQTSGYTGCTLFDFNGDGSLEVVYRDEAFLYIIDGNTGNKYPPVRCTSRTARDNPYIADVDADGETEICVICGTDDNASSQPNNFCNFGYSRYSQVRVYKTANEPWVPARRLWNQHAYFNVNINDNLKIPIRQQKHHLAYQDPTPCAFGIKNPRPLNSFLNQSPYFDERGCPTYVAPNIAVIENSLKIIPPTCPDRDFEIEFQITNRGNIAITKGTEIPISFYNGNPEAPGAIKLSSMRPVLVEDFGPPPANDSTIIDGDTITIRFNGGSGDYEYPLITGPGTNFTLYVAVNDNGTVAPLVPIPPSGKWASSEIIECDYGDNILSAPVTPDPFPLSAAKKQDNDQCFDTGVPNGSAYAYLTLDSSGEPVIESNYEFYWFAGDTSAIGGTPDFVGQIVTGLKDTIYSVYAKSKIAGCDSNPTSVTIGQSNVDFFPEVRIISNVTSCALSNGRLRGIVKDEDDNVIPDNKLLTRFSFAWYRSSEVGLPGKELGNGIEIGGLESGIPYTVVVTEKSSQCAQTAAGQRVAMDTVKYRINARAFNNDCSPTNTGSVVANVGGVVTNHTFYWSKGKTVRPSPSKGPLLSNLEEGFYTVYAIHNTTGCPTDTATVEVGTTATPSMEVLKRSDQTSCDPSRPNGEIKVNLLTSPPSKGFTIEWFKGQNTLASNRIDSLTGIQEVKAPNGLPIGVYTIKVTNNNTQCFATGEASLFDRVNIPEMDAVVRKYQRCKNDDLGTEYDGSIEAAIGGAGNPGDYTFFWYTGTEVDESNRIPGESGHRLNNIGDGDYTVYAVNNITYCELAPITRTMEGNTASVSINASIEDTPDLCGDADGELKVDISSVGNTSGFNVTWYRGKAPFTSADQIRPTEEGVSTSSIGGLSNGLYTALVVNRDNGCETSQEIALPSLEAPRLKVTGVPSDATTCSPGDEGTITVTLTPARNADGTPSGYDQGDYEIRMYEGSNTKGTLLSTISGITGVSDYIFNSLPSGGGLVAGEYTFVTEGTNPAIAGCLSVPFTIEIENIATDPEILPEIIANNLHCPANPGSSEPPNGSISTEIAGGAVGHTFNWFVGKGTSGAALPPAQVIPSPTGSKAVNLGGGTYTLEVINDATKCSTVKSFTVRDTPPVLSVTRANIAISPLRSCNTPDGSATVTHVMEDTTLYDLSDPVILGKYDFVWTDAKGVPLSAPASATDNSATGLDSGYYYVKIINVENNCFATEIGFEIEDFTPLNPTIDLTRYRNPTRCIQPFTDNLSGLLEIRASDDSTIVPNFAYQWYSVDPGTGINTTLAGETAPLLADVTAGSYRIAVTNNTTGCDNEDTYVLKDIVSPVELEVSTAPMTVCDIDSANGEAIAYVIGVSPDQQSNYTFNWYLGDKVKATPDSVSRTIERMVNGQYTVVAIDNQDSICTAQKTVTIGLEQIYPEVDVIAISPNTYCDEEKANGVAQATVGGSYIDYTFEWYEEDPRTSSDTAVHTGTLITGLKPNRTYYVKGTDNTSFCEGYGEVLVTDAPDFIQTPLIKVVRHQTSCIEDQPNGMLRAYVIEDGLPNTQDYIFTWYEGAYFAVSEIDTSLVKPLDIKDGFNSTQGPLIDSLKAGIYTVLAVNRITGCAGVNVREVLTEQLLPEFRTEIGAATCYQDNGYAAVFVTNSIAIESIVWDVGNGEVVVGPFLYSYRTEEGEGSFPAGDYPVTITTALGCVLQKTVTIPAIPNVYNGVSTNGDGINDFFKIGCIEDYPNNSLKIFNKAGQLVFETEGYTNDAGSRFEGISNRGVSIMGKRLPDGTYFYILDLGDGSELQKGYVEVVGNSK